MKQKSEFAYIKREGELMAALYDLVKWEQFMGGFEGPAWDRAREIVKLYAKTKIQTIPTRRLRPRRHA